MPSFRVLTGAAMLSAVALAGCGSSSSTTNATESSTTTIVADTTTTGAVTSTTVGTLGTTGTTAQPVVTNPPATNPPATNPPVFTSFNVSNAAACPAPDVTFNAGQPEVTVSWNAPTADSVKLYLDNNYWGEFGNSGTETLPASCDASLHNVHTYKAVAIKNGSEIASKSATRGY